MDKAWDVAAQIKQGVHFDCRLGRAKVRPWKHRQAQIDGGRIQGVSRICQIESKILTGIKFSGLSNQTLGKVSIDAPVARLVGVGQGRASNRLPKTHVIELGTLSRQTNFDVPQALAPGQLGECHCPELLCACQRAHALVSPVTRNIAGERRPGQEVHELSEQCLAGIHHNLRDKSRKPARIARRRSNRHHPLSLGNPLQSWLSATRYLI